MKEFSFTARHRNGGGTRRVSTLSLEKNKQRWVTLGAYLVVLHALLAYGLPPGIFLLLTVLFGVLYYRVDALESATMSLSVVIVTLLYGAVLKVTGLENMIYYRPDEMLSTFDYTHKHPIYAKNAVVEMTMPHGDLQPMTNEGIAEPRNVVYKIDSYGFRNDADYRGQRCVLVGDSFVVGSGNTQADILSSQLARDYGIDVYNLAHHGSLEDYAAYVSGFREAYGGDFEALLFVFEGNDFRSYREEKHSAFWLFAKRYYKIFSDTNVYRVTWSLVRRAIRLSAVTASRYIATAEIGGRKVAFHTGYIDVTKRVNKIRLEDFEQAIQSMRANLAHVFFIPTSYRVYHRYIHPGEVLPNVQWDYLNEVCVKNGLQCTNLTEPLIKASDELLKKGILTWWADDTHWNRHGVAVAARVVAGVLRQENE